MLGFVEGERIESTASFMRTMNTERLNNDSDKNLRSLKSVSNYYRDFSSSRCCVIRQSQFSLTSSDTCNIRLLNKS